MNEMEQLLAFRKLSKSVRAIGKEYGATPKQMTFVVCWYHECMKDVDPDHWEAPSDD